ncbi:hypothetical protein KXS03_27165 [Neorhizobium petrolearium]
MINNAGYGILGAAEELTDTQIFQQIATNLVSSIQILRPAIPYLRERHGARNIQIFTMVREAKSSLLIDLLCIKVQEGAWRATLLISP